MRTAGASRSRASDGSSSGTSPPSSPAPSPETIVFVAHRDNKGTTAGANDNASGTAALVELARGYATAGATESARTPLHTLVFLSTDAGAYGSLGAARFAAHSPLAERAVAVVSLDGIAGSVRPRIELSGLGGRSPPQALVRTATARVSAETGGSPALPGALTQLVSLGLPFGFGEQAPILGHHVPALRISTAPDGGVAPGGDELARSRLCAARPAGPCVGDAAQLAGSERRAADVDQRRDLPRPAHRPRMGAAAAPPGRGHPVRRGDVRPASRARRRRLPLHDAWRSLRRRVGSGCGPRDRGHCVARRRVAVRAGAAAAARRAAGRLLAARASRRARARRVPRLAALPGASPARATADAEDELAGYTVAFVALLLVAAGTALVSPYSLVFVLPSLYTWLWLPQLGRTPDWVTDVLFGAGLVGPVLALVVLAEQLDLGCTRTALRRVAHHDGGDSLGRRRWRSPPGPRLRASSAPSRRATTRRRSRRAAGSEPSLLRRARPSPRGTCTSASAAAARAIMCDSWPASGSSTDAVARPLDRRALEVVALRAATRRRASDARRGTAARGRRRPGAPERRQDEEQRADERGDRVPGQPEHERRAADAERERLARAHRDAPERPPRRRGAASSAHEVVRPDRDAARGDEDVRLERARERRPRARPRRPSTRPRRSTTAPARPASARRA